MAIAVTHIVAAMLCRWLSLSSVFFYEDQDRFGGNGLGVCMGGLFGYFRGRNAHEGDEAPVMQWDRVLITFFRFVAVFQMIKGMTHWNFILQGGGSTPGVMDASPEWLAANIYFAILDPVSAVGLWLTSSWGAVLWMLAAGSQIAMSAMFPQVFGALWMLAGWNVMLILTYGLLTYQVAGTRQGTY